jgi:hypothetical protein
MLYYKDYNNLYNIKLDTVLSIYFTFYSDYLYLIFSNSLFS